MDLRTKIGKGLPLLAGMLLALPGFVEASEFQLGYVFNSWSSNFISHGQESRAPASLRLTWGNFNLKLNASFVAGDYRQDATGTTPSSGFTASGFSDSSVAASWNIPMGGSHVSSFAGNLNIPSGDASWEARSENGSIPFIFEPGFYRGRGWGGSLFYTLASTAETLQWGLGAGYLFTTTYEMGLSGEGEFNPGDSLLVMGTLGGNLSETEKLGVRAVHSFPFQSKVSDPAARFTSGQSTVLSGQWLKKMGTDRLVLNLSYSFFSRGYLVDPLTLEQVRESQNFLGDRLEIRPSFGYSAGPGVSLETGLAWKRVFPNGYEESDTNHFRGGGNLFGVEQGITFQVGSGAFLNLAGLYHFILHDKAALDSTGQLTGVNYSRFSVGTNVGTKW